MQQDITLGEFLLFIESAINVVTFFFSSELIVNATNRNHDSRYINLNIIYIRLKEINHFFMISIYLNLVALFISEVAPI